MVHLMIDYLSLTDNSMLIMANVGVFMVYIRYPSTIDHLPH